MCKHAKIECQNGFEVLFDLDVKKRFFQGAIKDLYLIAASANPDSAMFNDVVHAYEQLCELLHFDKGGTLLCPGLAGADDLENHQEFLEKAVKMGMAI